MPTTWNPDLRYHVDLHVTYKDRRPRDIDNACKLAGDALNGIVWTDDSQIDGWTVTRGWNHDEPGITVKVTVLPDPPERIVAKKNKGARVHNSSCVHVNG